MITVIIEENYMKVQTMEFSNPTEFKQAFDGLMRDELLTVSEVCKLLKINKVKVGELRRAGLLPFTKLGVLKCRRSTVEEFMRKYEGMDLSDLTNIKPTSLEADPDRPGRPKVIMVS